ncbi:TPA: autotransporter outer membrane beta-barrel domain-containing protein [Enterobacter roggenkampii]|nr:autotransporter outer membrane beta-barrel domain-containing protein [Enterobacter roggenkampii]
MANNAVIESGGTQFVRNNGIASNTVISGGLQNIEEGGLATGTIILEGGNQALREGARAEDTLVKSGGSQSVYVGATAENTVIEGDAIQDVYGGTATDTTIKSGGVQKVSANDQGTSGVANNAVIESGGKQMLGYGGIANNTVISGGTQNVEGGLATGTIILEGGKQDLHEGARAEDTLVKSGGSQSVNAGATAANTVIEGDAIQDVYGGTATDTTIKSGGVQKVTGTDNGLGEIVSNGVANNTVIKSGGLQLLNPGAIATNTVISGGLQNIGVDARATGTIILEGGSQNIFAGGRAEDTLVMSGGSQSVNAGATAANTVIEGDAIQDVYGGTATDTTIKSGGVQKVTGTDNGMGEIVSNGVANNTVIKSGGLQLLNPGAIATNTVISGGLQNIGVDGRATGTIILDGGSQNIFAGGRAEDTLVKSGGSQSVTTDATAENTVIEGGTQRIYLGGTAKNTTLTEGLQTVYGTIIDTTLDGGQSLLFGGARAEGYTKVNSGANLVIYTNAVAEDVTLNGGTLNVAALSDSSTGHPSAQVDTLTMNDGLVRFNSGYTYGYAQLNIGELNGKGNIWFETSLADKTGNFVTIGQGSGNFGVIVQDSGKEITDHTDLTLNLINDQGGDLEFSLQSTRGASTRAIDGGAYMYVLKQETGKDGMDGNVWYLGAMTEDENGGDNGNSSGNGGDNGNSGGSGGDNGNGGGNDGDNGNSGGNDGDNGNGGGNGGGSLVTTPSTDAVLSLASAGLNIMRGEMDGLRAARQSQSSDRQHGEGSVWGHYLGKKSAAETSNGAAYKLYQNGMELGGDVVTDLGNSQLVTGGFVTLTSNNVKHARGGTSSVDSYGLGAYATWYDNSGFYLDGTLKANRLESQLSARMTNGNMTSGKWNQYGFSAALEVGQTFIPTDSLSVTPFARMTGTIINDANVKLNNGMTAKTGKARSLTAEAGSRVATELSLGNTSLHPYLSLSVEQELAHSNETVINDVNRFKNNQNGTSGRYGAGITISPAKDVTLYGELNYRQGSYVEEPVQGMAGIRISF